MKNTIALVGLLTFSTLTNGQDNLSPKITIKSSSISLGLVGAPSTPIGLSYGQMLSERFSFEIGAGILSAGAGFNFFLTNPARHRLNLHTGLFAAVTYDGYPMLYLPVGVTYFGKRNFQYGADIGLLYSEGVGSTVSGPPESFWFGLKIGYRFGKDLATLRAEPRIERKNIISLILGFGDPLFGITYERLITPFWGAEAGLGIFGVTAGSRFYFPALVPGHLNFHIGVSESWGFMLFIGGNGFRTYFPVGITILGKNNIRFSVDMGPQIWHQDNNDVTPSFSVRLGKAF